MTCLHQIFFLTYVCVFSYYTHFYPAFILQLYPRFAHLYTPAETRYTGYITFGHKAMPGTAGQKTFVVFLLSSQF